MAAKIDKLTFGSITIRGTRYNRDIVIFPDGRIRERVGGLGVFGFHNINIEEIEGLIVAKPDVLIIGTGAFEGAKLTPEAQELIAQSNVELKVLNSFEAVKEFNTCVEKGKATSALIHITC